MRPSRVLLLLFALVLPACGVAESPAARVGDATITNAELASDVPLYRFLSNLSGAPCGQPDGDESDTNACTRFTLTNDIREEIVKAYATEHDLAVDPDAVDSALAQVEQNMGGEEALKQQLGTAGLTRADLHELARRLLLFNEVQQAVTSERLTDDALRSLYERNLEQFTTVEVSHILVDSEQAANRIAATVTATTFAQTARRESTDRQSARNGGSLGTYSETQFRQTFDPTFVDAALALQPGQISAPVQTQFGWHVIYLVREDAASFEQVRDQLVAQQSGQVFGDWLIERIGALDVQVNPRYGRLDPDTGEVLRVSSTAASPSPLGAATGGTGANP
jgi:parvulin-like peptidyl-prolyl isomerase